MSYLPLIICENYVGAAWKVFTSTLYRILMNSRQKM